MGAEKTVKRIRFLSAEHVSDFHDQLLNRWGGHPGGGHRGHDYAGVEAAVQAVKNSYYESVEELAAAYAVYIVQGHVFLDGNKRTGLAAMRAFLRLNRMTFDVEQERLSELMIELQTRSESGEDAGRLIAWLSSLIREHKRPVR